MISRPISARRSCVRRSRARLSTSTAIPQARRSIPVKRRPSFARRQPLTASRSIARARRRTTRKSPRARRRISIPIMRRSERRSRGCAGFTARSRFTIAIPSARSSRACSRANSLRSISGPTAAPAPTAGLSADVVEVLEAGGKDFVVNGRFKGGWITRSFGDPARGR